MEREKNQIVSGMSQMEGERGGESEKKEWALELSLSLSKLEKNNTPTYGMHEVHSVFHLLFKTLSSMRMT